MYYDGTPLNIPKITDEYCCQKLFFWDDTRSDFQLVNLGTDRVFPNYSIQNRRNSSLTLNFILSGKGTFNGQPFSAGQCYYVRPRQIQYIVSDPEDPWYSVWLTVDGELGKALTNRLDKVSINQMLPIQSPDTLLDLANMYISGIGLVHNTGDFVEGMIKQFISFILPEDEESTSISPRMRMIVDQSIIYIKDNISTVTVQHLAQRVHLEIKYFTRIFTLVMKCSPQEFIMKTRMKIAAEYLTSTEYTIDQISEFLGYNHRNCLTIPFKKRYGMTPPEYRAKYEKSLGDDKKKDT